MPLGYCLTFLTQDFAASYQNLRSECKGKFLVPYQLMIKAAHGNAYDHGFVPAQIPTGSSLSDLFQLTNDPPKRGRTDQCKISAFAFWSKEANGRRQRIPNAVKHWPPETARYQYRAGPDTPKIILRAKAPSSQWPPLGGEFRVYAHLFRMVWSVCLCVATGNASCRRTIH